MKAPVILFVYRRVEKTKECLAALEANYGVEKSDLIIYADGSKGEKDIKDVLEVRNYLREYQTKSLFRKVEIIEAEKNQGLANSIIKGVTEVINRYEKAIIVEDDLITAPDFLQYMNEALDFYENIKEYGSISAYTCPVRQLKKYKKDIYVTRKGECWGWATWKDRWEKVDWSVSQFDSYINNSELRKQFNELQFGIDNMLCDWKEGRVDSWAVRWCFHLFMEKLLTVYPRISKTKNIGFDGTGTNCGDNFEDKGKEFAVNLKKCHFEVLGIDYKLEHAVSIYEKETLVKAVKRKIRKIIKLFT